MMAGPASPLDKVNFNIRGDDAELRAALIEASLTRSAKRENLVSPQEVLAAANADYARMTGVLYANGYYGGTIHILVDGAEAALIPPFSVPRRISNITVKVDPGSPFRFGAVKIVPLAPGTQLPSDFRRGARAKSVLVQEAVEQAVKMWRAIGFAKATPSGQSVVADHAAKTLSARIQIATGPLVRFGQLILNTESSVRAKSIRRIGGLPTGETFSPEALTTVAERLRRTGAFRSVALKEAEQLGPNNTLDIGLTLIDEKPRRFGFGAELSSLEGLTLSGFWLHRNFFGGAERLRVYGEVANIAGETGGIDYTLGARIERAAAYGPDTKLFIAAEVERLDEPDFRSDQATLGIGAVKTFSKGLELELGIALRYSEVQDSLGTRDFTLLTFPSAATLDRRDDRLSATKGYYASIDAIPFVGFDGSDFGARVLFDGRVYRGFGTNENIVLAGRAQLGSVVAATTSMTPPDYLFYSGGGGTVRGQPYQSLDVDLGGGQRTGGRSFIGFSTEIRAGISEKFSLVGFLDSGYIGAENVYNGDGNWHSGGGLGVRYDTAVGPIRFDVATPLSGGTGSGIQLYLGIGQAF